MTILNDTAPHGSIIVMKPRRAFNLSAPPQKPNTTPHGVWCILSLVLLIITGSCIPPLSKASKLSQTVAWHEERANWRATAGGRSIKQAQYDLQDKSPTYARNRRQAEIYLMEAESHLRLKAEAEEKLDRSFPLSVLWFFLIASVIAFLFCLYKATTSSTHTLPPTADSKPPAAPDGA